MPTERLLYEQSNFPIFQNRMYETLEDARSCPRGDIRLVQNSHTGLVYNAAFRSNLMEYDAAYQNEQAYSVSFKYHLTQVASIVERLLGTNHLVEVGCGKAYFLELLQSRGCSITGFDPSYEGSNHSVQRHYFGQGVSVSAHGIILRHVLEHIAEPIDFLEHLRDANKGGLIYIEVPCFDWILRKRAWFDIFYEHVNYFRLADFGRIFTRLIEAGHLFGGQYLYIVADLASLRKPGAGDHIQLPEDFLPQNVSRDGKGLVAPRVVWGAASKGVIYTLLRERAGAAVEILIDINPAKCGRFVPATGLRVMSPTEGMTAIAEGEDICVMNPNYLNEVRLMSGNRFNLIGVELE